MATQLGLYNRALRHCGERRLASLTENREPRRVLDDIWNDGIVETCLSQGFWNFAMRAIEIPASTLVTPAFGWSYAFEKPTDLQRVAGLSADETFNTPLTQYMDEIGYWLANVTPLYVRYISNSLSYGKDLSRWPQMFTDFVAASMALQLVPTLTQDEKRIGRVASLVAVFKTQALNIDAMDEATQFMPQGGWTAARQGRGSKRERGNDGGPLIG